MIDRSSSYTSRIRTAVVVYERRKGLFLSDEYMSVDVRVSLQSNESSSEVYLMECVRYSHLCSTFSFIE